MRVPLVLLGGIVVLSVAVARALSCVCSPLECDVLTDDDCPGGLTWDPCRCCKVCARVEGEPCGGLFGFSGSCAVGLQCVIKNLLHHTKEVDEGTCTNIFSHDCLRTPLVQSSDKMKNNGGTAKAAETTAIIKRLRELPEQKIFPAAICFIRATSGMNPAAYSGLPDYCLIRTNSGTNKASDIRFAGFTPDLGHCWLQNVICCVREVGILKFEGPWVYRMILLDNLDGVLIRLVFWDDAAVGIDKRFRPHMILKIDNVLVIPYNYPNEVNNGSIDIELIYERDSSTVEIINWWKVFVGNSVSSASGCDP